MRRRLEGLMSKYGQTVQLTRQGDERAREVKAFLQPVLKRREDLPVTATPLGAANDQRWLYVGSWAQEVDPGDRMVWGDLRLVVQEARAVQWQDGILYYWAMLRREKEAAI